MITAFKSGLYKRLLSLPENLTGEILDGQLYTQPRPRGSHARVETVLSGELVDPFDPGREGPGGGWILVEPQIHLVRDTEVIVPDVAGVGACLKSPEATDSKWCPTGL